MVKNNSIVEKFNEWNIENGYDPYKSVAERWDDFYEDFCEEYENDMRSMLKDICYKVYCNEHNISWLNENFEV